MNLVYGTRTAYSHKPGTNRLSGIATAGTTTTVTSTPTGNLATMKTGGVTTETLVYNQANQLTSAQTTSTFASYAYDLTGQRLEKSQPGVNPILYQFNRTGGELLSENDLHNGVTADYIYLDPGRNSQPLGEVNPTTGKLYFTHTDKLGTPQALTDSTQSVAWSATYQPFGSTVQFNGPLATQSLRLPGQQFDAETGYNHNGFRNYAGTLTRFVESDPVGLNGGMNTYQYVGGNPFKWTDRRGLDLSTVKEGYGVVGDVQNILNGVIEGLAANTRPYPGQFIWPLSEENIAQTTYALKQLYKSLFPTPCPTQQELTNRALSALQNGNESSLGFRISSVPEPGAPSQVYLDPFDSAPVPQLGSSQK